MLGDRVHLNLRYTRFARRRHEHPHHCDRRARHRRHPAAGLPALTRAG
ncbi:MAG: hypothetical protein AVDCRST_MAG47-2024 [uncultured Nocardioidaceae bacterium]|uniref:Uncharacterized protein n=1 Tax=uncultured Nocardioidaceae bacterium TaxID=253824 RepID=A0A6J4NB97_9ACTN|nr:MAG: hypothetical protein AVDCRST_MAG47-2024 [uncultured Nocardioidaceae bacterium]